MSDYNFIEVDAEQIKNDTLMNLTWSTGEELYQGDERRIFGEGLSSVLISERNAVNAGLSGRVFGR